MTSKSLDICTIMFADVAGSTKLYEELGDELANEIISEAIFMMEKKTELFFGRVIKTIGDEIMCRFETSDNAAKAAIQIQEKLDFGLIKGVYVAVRIGFHTGPVITQGEGEGDIFGDTVNVAARMAAIAKGRQIVISQKSANQLSPEIRQKARHYDRVKVKGKSQEIDICDLVWESAEVTKVISINRLMEEIKNELVLKCGQYERILRPTTEGIQLGRSKGCDLIVKAELASRFHAKISVERGKFVLSDQSTNGTFVKTRDGERYYLRRESLPLVGSGKISLGIRVSDAKAGEIVKFEVRLQT